MIFGRFEKTWEIREMAVHYFLASLLSVTYINSSQLESILLHILNIFPEFTFVDTLAIDLRRKRTVTFSIH